VAYEKLAEARQGESSKNIRERVARAPQIQEQRFRNSSSRNNSGMNRKELETHAELADSSRKILLQAKTKMGLSDWHTIGFSMFPGLLQTWQVSRKLIRLMLQRSFSIEIWIVRFKCWPEI